MDAPDERPTRLLKVSDIIYRTQLSRSKVYQLIAEGDLPSVAIGRTRRVREAELESWLRAQSAPVR